MPACLARLPGLLPMISAWFSMAPHTLVLKASKLESELPLTHACPPATYTCMPAWLHVMSAGSFQEPPVEASELMSPDVVAVYPQVGCWQGIAGLRLAGHPGGACSAGHQERLRLTGHALGRVFNKPSNASVLGAGPPSCSQPGRRAP